MFGSLFRRENRPVAARNGLRARRERAHDVAHDRSTAGRSTRRRFAGAVRGRTSSESAATLVEYVLFMALFLLVAAGAVGAMNDGARQYFTASAERIGKPVNHDRGVEAPYTPGGGGADGPIDWTTASTATPPTTQVPSTTAVPTTAPPTTAAPTTTVPPTTVPPTTAAPTTTVPPTTTAPTTTTPAPGVTTTTTPSGGWNGQVQMWFGSQTAENWNNYRSNFTFVLWSTGNVPVNSVTVTVTLYQGSIAHGTYTCVTPPPGAEARCTSPSYSVPRNSTWRVTNVSAPTWDGVQHTAVARR